MNPLLPIAAGLVLVSSEYGRRNDIRKNAEDPSGSFRIHLDEAVYPVGVAAVGVLTGLAMDRPSGKCLIIGSVGGLLAAMLIARARHHSPSA